MKLVHFGAGNIGRSFVGQLFSRAGWDVVFIDIDRRIIDELNKKRQYKVMVKDKEQETIVVKNVRGVYAMDLEKASNEVMEADLVSTAVGKDALSGLIQPIARGLERRKNKSPSRPLDIIICENMINAASFFKECLRRELSRNFPIEKYVGLVETSIGKMVPIMSEKDRRRDPLLVFAEAYNTLIVDKNGFQGMIPDIPGIDPKENMKAFVDRKLYIHNMGHAVLSYTAFVFRKKYRFIWEAAYDKELHGITKNAMWESGKALVKEYPDEFNEKNIEENIDDLLLRFGNRALGDTIYRAGRDLYRKLGPDDRLTGSVMLCLKHDIFPKHIALGIACALFFEAVDDRGEMFEKDIAFHEKEIPKGTDHVFKNICKMENKAIKEIIKYYYDNIIQGNLEISTFGTQYFRTQ